MIGRIFNALDAACDKLDKKPTATNTTGRGSDLDNGPREQTNEAAIPRKRPLFAGKWEPVRATTKSCPQYAESVKRDAQVCKHCSYRFSEADEAAIQSFEAQETDALIQLEGHSLKLQKGCLFLFLFVGFVAVLIS